MCTRDNQISNFRPFRQTRYDTKVYHIDSLSPFLNLIYFNIEKNSLSHIIYVDIIIVFHRSLHFDISYFPSSKIFISFFFTPALHRHCIEYLCHTYCILYFIQLHNFHNNVTRFFPFYHHSLEYFPLIGMRIIIMEYAVLFNTEYDNIDDGSERKRKKWKRNIQFGISNEINCMP